MEGPQGTSNGSTAAFLRGCWSSCIWLDKLGREFPCIILHWVLLLSVLFKNILTVINSGVIQRCISCWLEMFLSVRMVCLRPELISNLSFQKY